MAKRCETQPAFTCSKLTTKTLEQGVKYVQGYLLKVNNRNTRARGEICSRVAIKTPEERHCFSAFIVNFEHVIAGWEGGRLFLTRKAS